MILAGTGHRPDKLGGYAPAARAELIRVAVLLLKAWQPSRVISGMALGWDTALAMAAVLLDIPLVAAVPFAGQECRWPLESQRTYTWLLERAAAVEVVCPGGYSARKMQIRNMALVDECDYLLACWDGSSGGTANCLDYARSVGRPFYNCYPDLTLPSWSP